MLMQRGGNIVIDPSSQCPKEYCRLTFEKFPESENLRQRAGSVPLSAIYRPFNDTEGSPNVAVVNFGSIPVVRCRRCRSYISPFSFFIEHGRKWQCALCWNLNDIEPEYYCQLNPETGKRLDHMQRAELNAGIIDIIAPDEYTLRPPTPPAFLFVIDVSKQAVASGLLQAVSIGIKRSLSRLPGQPRTQVGFITFDSEVHFYDLSGGPDGTGGPRMLVVSDLAGLFHPTSTDELLVDLLERRQAIDTLLDQLVSMHPGHSTESALGPAIEVAYDIMAPFGGKMSVFQAQLPMMVEFPANEDKDREKTFMNFGGLPKPGRGADGKALGGPKEHDLLMPGSIWYQSRADMFVRQHISVDWYCCTSVYCDLATCAELCHLTAGRLRYYPGFHASKDGERLTQDMFRSLTGPCATEGVMRVRASVGVKVNRFHGSFSMRAKDLIALPQSDPDGTYTFEFAFEEDQMPGKFIALQGAVLYTTLNGERRIRVTNQAIPLTNNPLEVLQGIQPDVVVATLLKRAAEEARSDVGGLDQARNQLKVSFWKMLESPGFAQNCPQLVDALARGIVGAIKSPALRGGTDIGSDERYFWIRFVGRSTVERLMLVTGPKLYQLSFAVGGSPKELAPTKQSLTSDSVLVLDNGFQIMIRIGAQAPANVFQQLFGSEDAIRVNPLTLRLAPLAPQGGSPESPLRAQVWAILNSARKNRPEDWINLVVVREGDASIEPRFYWGLVNDPATFRGGEVTVEELIIRGSKAAMASMNGVPGRPQMGPVGPNMMQPRGVPSQMQMVAGAPGPQQGMMMAAQTPAGTPTRQMPPGVGVTTQVRPGSPGMISGPQLGQPQQQRPASPMGPPGAQLARPSSPTVQPQGPPRPIMNGPSSSVVSGALTGTGGPPRPPSQGMAVRPQTGQPGMRVGPPQPGGIGGGQMGPPPTGMHGPGGFQPGPGPNVMRAPPTQPSRPGMMPPPRG